MRVNKSKRAEEKHQIGQEEYEKALLRHREACHQN
jgi:hypothetical protein